MSNLPFIVPSVGTAINVKDYGAVGDGSTPDHVAIQAALDDGDGTVLIPASATSYITTSKLTVPSGVTLVIERGAIIECTANAHVIEIKPEAFVTGGGTVYNSSGDATSACLFLDATTDTFTRTSMNTGASNLLLRNSANHVGYGIYLYSSNSSAALQRVEWTKFSDINIAKVGDAIRLEADETSGDVSYVNGNSFNNIGIEYPDYGVRTLATGTGSAAVSGNTFTNIQIQCDASLDRAIYEEGSNFYDDIKLYDVVTATPIEFTVGGNYLNCSGVAIDEITMDNNVNVIHSSVLPSLQTRVTDASLASDDSQWVGGLVYVSDKLCLAYNRGNQWNYIGGLREQVITDATTSPGATGVGVSFVNTGSATPNTVNLPPSKVGQECIVRRDNATHALLLNPFSTEKFRYLGADGTSAGQDGKYISLDSDGAIVHVKCYIEDIWEYLIREGTISDEA